MSKTVCRGAVGCVFVALGDNIHFPPFSLGGILVFALGCQSRRVSAVGTGCFLPYCLFCFMALSEKGKDGMQADDMGVGN